QQQIEGLIDKIMENAPLADQVRAVAFSQLAEEARLDRRLREQDERAERLEAKRRQLEARDRVLDAEERRLLEKATGSAANEATSTTDDSNDPSSVHPGLTVLIPSDMNRHIN
ncbi:MAG: hypothetical protein AAF653_02115, partial [Chloroflexota bacterium]